MSVSKPGRGEIWARLAREIEGDLCIDEGARRLYANDASIYEQLPLAVARPKSREDCIALVAFAKRHAISLIARGAGTSLAGQCVGEGLIVDTARYMDRVIEVDVASRTATVEPGTVPARLNASLAAHHLRFAPYPSTGDRCTLGGMLGNNAWGTHVLRDGMTRDKVVALETVLSDASPAEFRALSEVGVERGIGLDGVEGDAYRDTLLTMTQNLAAVRARFPRSGGPINNGGYALDVLAAMQPFEPLGPPLNLAPLFAGSEGTLGLVTRITLSLDGFPPERRLLCPRFASIESALASVPGLRAVGAVAVELLDAHILALAETQPVHRPARERIGGRPAAVLLIELADPDTAVLQKRARALVGEMLSQPGCEACAVVEGGAVEAVWALRRAGLGMLMGRPGPRRAVSGLEDASVPLERMGELWRWVQDRAASLGVELIAYGPVSVGVLHLRPLLALEEPDDRASYERLMADLAGQVHALGGYFTAKHGDGRMRGHYLIERFGPQVMAAFGDIKSAFDPRGLFNPGKILDPPPLTADLRYRRPATTDLRPAMDWSRQNGLLQAAQQCHGAGVCLRQDGEVMCPSYRATREEQHGVRGRANLLRQVLTAAERRDDLADPLLMEALALCVSCKACRLECPAGTDVAALKAEVLQVWHEQHGVPLSKRLLAAWPELSAVGARMPRLANSLLGLNPLHGLLGTDPARPLPRLAEERFSRWWHRRGAAADGSGPRVGLLVDPVSEFYEPQIAKAAVRVLEGLDYRVEPIGPVSLGRLEISLGLLDRARERARATLNRITASCAAPLPIVGLEPSEILTLRDELPGLLTDTEARRRCAAIAERAYLWQEFVLGVDLPPIETQAGPVGVGLHVHCHERALVGGSAALDCLTVLPGVRPEMLPSGCCGMAGAFGYQQGQGELSRRIGEAGPLPEIRAAPAETLIVATGSSCRQQIRLETERQALHPAELWERILHGRQQGSG